ncbi:MAG: LCP family protein [Elusimicrobia bacterium]|nr:LCP family protein [Elusimicrobiota bacterium]
MGKTGLKLFPSLFGLLLILAIAGSLWISSESVLSQNLQKEEPVFGLLIGAEELTQPSQLKLIALARYDPKTRDLDLLSIPINTKLGIPGQSNKKINEIFSLAYKQSNFNQEFSSRELIRVVEWLLFSKSKTFHPKISFFLKMDYKNLGKLVNSLGGSRGWQEEFREELFLDKEKKSFFLEGLFRFKDGNYRVNSNLNKLEKFLLFFEMKDLSQKEIRFFRLPGTLKEDAWVPLTEEIQTTVQLLFTRDQKNQLQGFKQNFLSKNSTIKLGVWNASNRKNKAWEAAQILRKEGFDVMQWGNYSSFQKRSWVQDYKGDPSKARELKKLLFFPELEILTQVQRDSLVDMDLILGEDYDSD